MADDYQLPGPLALLLAAISSIASLIIGARGRRKSDRITLESLHIKSMDEALDRLTKENGALQVSLDAARAHIDAGLRRETELAKMHSEAVLRAEASRIEAAKLHEQLEERDAEIYELKRQLAKH